MRVVQTILAVVSIIVITMMIDLFSIGDKDKPLIYTKTETSETYTYYRGLVYDVYDCFDDSLIKGVFIVKKGDKFNCAKKIEEVVKKIKVKSIVDQTSQDSSFICDNKKEVIIENEFYKYYFDCTKSKYVIVTYDDGTKDTLISAIEKGLVTIETLKEYKIAFKEEKKVNYKQEE